MRAFLDTNIAIRHLTGDPPATAVLATRFLAGTHELVLPDVVVAEIAYVLESNYRLPRPEVAQRLMALVALPGVTTVDSVLVVRALETYESHRIGFADAYLVASAERSGVGAVASFDRDIDRVGTVERVEPA